MTVSECYTPVVARRRKFTLMVFLDIVREIHDPALIKRNFFARLQSLGVGFPLYVQPAESYAEWLDIMNKPGGEIRANIDRCYLTEVGWRRWDQCRRDFNLQTTIPPFAELEILRAAGSTVI